MNYRVTLDIDIGAFEDPPETWDWARLLFFRMDPDVASVRLVQSLKIPDENQVASAPTDIVMVLQGQVDRLQKDVAHFKGAFEGAVSNCESLQLERDQYRAKWLRALPSDD